LYQWTFTVGVNKNFKAIEMCAMELYLRHLLECMLFNICLRYEQTSWAQKALELFSHYPKTGSRGKGVHNYLFHLVLFIKTEKVANF
ncbi:hypothetical protein ACJX0J_033502, partial [Zea mays]